MARKDLFALGENNEGISFPPRDPGSGGASASITSSEIAALTSYSGSVPSTAPAGRLSLSQELIDSVLKVYADNGYLDDQGSDFSKFFTALSGATTDEELRLFSRVYIDLNAGVYGVSDFLVYARKAGLGIDLRAMASFVEDSSKARVAGMREKIYNGVFPSFGNLHAFIIQNVFNDPGSQVVLRDVQEGDEVLRQGNSLILKPRVSYYGGDSYETYRQASEDYWSISESYLVGTLLSSVTTRTATISQGKLAIPSVSPNTTAMARFQKLFRVPVDGEQGRFGYDASLALRLSTSARSSAKHLASGDITFKSGFPATFQTNLSKSVLDALFNRHSGGRPQAEAALVADPARKPSYTSERTLNAAIDSIGRGLYERLSRDEILSELSSAISEMADDLSIIPFLDFEDPLDLPDIEAFVSGKLSYLDSIAAKDYDLATLRTLKFYKYVMAPFVGISSGGAFTKETNISSEFSSLRSAISGLRGALIESGKFDPAQ